MSAARRRAARFALAGLCVVALGACTLPPMWWFVKGTNTNSRLLFTEGNAIPIAEWRAGSGFSIDECQKETQYQPGGWLPNGSYHTPEWFIDHPGLRGPAIRLADHRCDDGTTWRDELFIHSSYPWTTSRYASHGCIKVSNTGGPSPASGQISEVLFVHAVKEIQVLIVE